MLLLEIVRFCVIIGVLLKDQKLLMKNLIRFIVNISKRTIKGMDFGLLSMISMVFYRSSPRNTILPLRQKDQAILIIASLSQY